MVARLRWGANRAISRGGFFLVGPLRQFVQLLQRGGQRAVAHRRGIGKAHPHHHITRRPGADAALGGEFVFRRNGRALARPSRASSPRATAAAASIR